MRKAQSVLAATDHITKQAKFSTGVQLSAAWAEPVFSLKRASQVGGQKGRGGGRVMGGRLPVDNSPSG